jgi:5-methylcytosine-specific restriction protein A
MPERPPRPCPRKGYPPCPNYVGHTRVGQWLCDEHDRASRKATDKARGTAHQRGYGAKHRRLFAAEVLRRDLICQCTTCTDHQGRCLAQSEHADHYPRTRKAIVQAGDDPYDPAYGRGLCERCHNRHTARTSARVGYRRPRKG